jgi:hypothetical protein
MAKLRQQSVIADFIAAAVAPGLVMGMIFCLISFLILVFYRDGYQIRVNYLFALYIFASVLIARIAIESGRAYAMTYTLALGLAMMVVISRFAVFQGPLAALSPLINLGLISLVGYLADRIVFDCTLVEADRDTSGEGLLQSLGLVRSDISKEPAENRKRKRKHNPGVTILYFALLAIPLYGIGQLFLPSGNDAIRRSALYLLFGYFFCSFALLVTTSFLGLRRYLNDRGVEVPAQFSVTWLSLGLVGTLIFLGLCLFLPLPGRQFGLFDVPFNVRAMEGLTASRWGWGQEGAENSSPGDPQTQHANSQSNSESSQDSPGGQSGGSSGQNSSRQNSSGQSSSGQSSSQSGNSPSNQSQSPSSGSDSQQQAGSPSQNSQPNKPQPGKPQPGKPQSGDSPSGDSPSGDSQSGNSQSGDSSARDSSSSSSSSQDKGSSQDSSPSSGRDSQLPSQDSQGQGPGESTPKKNGRSSDRDSSENASSGSQKSDRNSNNSDEETSDKREDSNRQANENRGSSPSNDSQQNKNETRSGKAEAQPEQSPQSQSPQSQSSQSQSSQAQPAQSQPPQPQSTPPSNSNWFNFDLGSWLGVLFKWITIAVLIGVVAYYVIFHRDELMKLWRDFLKWWNGLWGGTEDDTLPAVDPSLPQPKRRRSFASFKNPFQRGDKIDLAEAIRYTFDAMDAWGAERGLERKGETTAEEYVRSLGALLPRNKEDLVGFSNAYTRLAYAGNRPVSLDLAVLQRLWQSMEQQAPAPSTIQTA